MTRRRVSASRRSAVASSAAGSPKSGVEFLSPLSDGRDAVSKSGLFATRRSTSEGKAAADEVARASMLVFQLESIFCRRDSWRKWRKLRVSELASPNLGEVVALCWLRPLAG